MKTLQQIKDEYAKSLGEENWYEFKQNYHKGEIELAMDSIIEKLLSNNVKNENFKSFITNKSQAIEWRYFNG